MVFELGVYSFGNTPLNADGSVGATADAVRDLLQCIQLADEVGLDFFGVGEHHTVDMPVSSPSAVINAAAASTRQIGLGSAVSVLSTDDPVRVYQQHATAAALAPGRVEITAGRGSSTDSFPLFGYDLDDYDALFAAKLELLLEVNANERVTWNGPFRDRPLENALVVPRPDAPLKIWLGTGGNPESSVRAGLMGLPVAYGILGGSTERWVQTADLYRRAFAQSGAPGIPEVSVASHGFLADDSETARDIYYAHEGRMMSEFAAARGGSAPPRAYFDANYGPGGMIMVGGPDEIAARLVDFHRALGHTRHIIQMDVGHLPQALVLESIRLLGAEVLPRVRAALA